MTQTMNCQELVELITEYLEGTLSAPDRARFEQHLSGCTGCRNYLAQMRQTIQLVGALTPEAIPLQEQNELLQLFSDWKKGRP